MELCEITDSLRSSRLDQAADRLDHLCNLAADDPDGTPVDLESVRHFASFVTARRIPPPEIGVNPEGLIHAEWASQKRGTLVLVFPPYGMIKFTAVLKKSKSRSRAWRNAGTKSPDEMRNIVGSFLDTLMKR